MIYIILTVIIITKEEDKRRHTITINMDAEFVSKKGGNIPRYVILGDIVSRRRCGCNPKPLHVKLPIKKYTCPGCCRNGCGGSEHGHVPCISLHNHCEYCSSDDCMACKYEKTASEE